MDYDTTQLPEGYDRGRNHGPEVLDLWMARVGAYVSPRAVVDLGCGTGRFTLGLASSFGARVVGIDPSWKMLQRARQKSPAGDVAYVRGSGEAIPLADAQADAVFMSMVFHHLSDPPAVAREFRRVLRPGGMVLIRTGTSDRISKYPYVPFFPKTVPLLESRLPSVALVTDTFESAGFQTAAVELVVQTIAPSFLAYADKLAAGGDSVLASLPQEDFDAGMSALRAHADAVDPLPVSEPIDFLVFR